MLAAGKGVVAGAQGPARGGIPRDRQRVLLARVDEDARGEIVGLWLAHGRGWGSITLTVERRAAPM